MKLLVVEDSRFFRLAMEKVLSKAGYQVISASDGDEALRRARGERPDAILLDLLLPKTAGLDVLKELKRDAATSGIPVIVLTGLSPRNAAKLQKDGAAAYLEKSEHILNSVGGAPSPLVIAIEKVVNSRAHGDIAVGQTTSK